jgi:hypothetical protein
MRPHAASATLAAVSLAALLAACGAAASVSTSAARPAPASAPAIALGSVGDTATFKISRAVIGYGPDRVTFEMSRLGYITLIGVDSANITPILPLVSETPRIEMAGPHTFGLNARAKAVGAVSVIPENTAELQAYNRCVTQAIAYDKAREQQSRKVIGRDSAGRPIYGPPEPIATTESAERRCVDPSTRQVESATSQPALPARPGRYLLLYVSDTPVNHEAIVALKITENDPRLMTISIGRKLFNGRDALWAGYFRNW